jgi:predicted RNA binding protein YcfA (HicA-like mRNA interferase family)
VKIPRAVLAFTLLKHPTTGKEVWVAVHTKKDAGRLGNRILREAGVE